MLKGIVYLIDDVLVHSTTQEEHDKNLLAVLSHIQDAGLTLTKKDKCEFNTNSIKWLDQVVDPSDIRPDSDKVKLKPLPVCPNQLP